MAARYWVGGTGTWDASDTTHWSATSGGSGGASVPGASDDVFFDANSGAGTATKTIAGNTIRSLDMTGYTGSLLWNTYGIIGSTSSGDITIRFSSAITWANDLYIVSASGFTTTVYMSGSRPGAVTNLNQNVASTGTILLADAWVQQATADLAIGNATSSTGTVIFAAGMTMRNITVTSGTVHFDGAADNSGLSHTLTGTFNSSNTNTRSIYLGNCTITLSLTFSTSVWNFTTYTNLTFNAGTSTVIISGNGSGIYGGFKTFNNIQLTSASFAVLFQVVATNITRTGTAAKTDYLDLYSDITCTNLTITGNSILNRILVRSQTVGTPSTLTVTGSLTLNNVDFRDVTTSGAAWSSPTITGGVGDAGGNSATISGFTPSATQYWKTTTAGSKNWSTAGNWFLATNGGGGAGRVPLPQDDVVFDANSIGAASTTIQIDMPRVGRSLYFTGVTNSPTLSLVVAHTLYGNLTLVSGMSVSGTVTTTFEGRGSYTLTTAAKTFGGIVMNGVGGTLTVSGNLTVSTGGISITAGTLDCSVNNPTVSTPSITATGVVTKALKMGSGTWTTTGTGASAWSTPTAASGFTLTAGASTLIFTAASGGPTPTFGGQVLNNVTINTAAGVLVTLQDALVCTGVLTLTQGTLALNSKTTQAATFVSTGSSTRTLIPGSGTPVTLTAASGTVWNVSSSMGITNPIVAWTITPTGSGSVTFAGAGLTYRNLVFNGPTSPTISGANTFEALTLTGPAVKTCALTLAANQTVTGTLTFAGNSTVNRVLITSDVFGTQRTITNTGALMVWSNVDFRDIALVNAYDASGITGLCGDCGGNSNITFTAPQTNYWVAGNGSWSDATKWKLSDHTTAGRVPLPQDNVRFDGSSFTGTLQSVQADMPRLGKDIDWTGCTFSPTWITNVTLNTMYGSLTLVSTGAAMGGGSGFNFEGRGTHTITWAGITTTAPLIFAGTGSYTFQDAATVNASPGITLTRGTLASAYSITARSFISSNSNTRTLNLTGPMTLTSINIVWDLSTSTGLTITALPPSISITDTSTSNKTFAGGGKTYGDLSITGSGTGTVTISGSNTFGTFTTGAPKTVIFTSGTTQVVSGFVATGSAGNVITIQSSASGSPFTLSKASGNVGCNYLSLKDSTASGGATWYAGSQSADNLGNTGWLFSDAPAGSITGTALLLLHLLSAGSGSELFSGSGSVLVRPSVVTTGEERFLGTGSVSIRSNVTASALERYLGSGSVLLHCVINGAGSQLMSGVAAIQLHAAIASTGLERYIGTGSILIPAAKVSASALEQFVGSGVATIHAASEGAGLEAMVGSAVVPLTVVTQGTGIEELLAQGNVVLRPSVEGHGYELVIGGHRLAPPERQVIVTRGGRSHVVTRDGRAVIVPVEVRIVHELSDDRIIHE